MKANKRVKSMRSIDLQGGILCKMYFSSMTSRNKACMSHLQGDILEGIGY